MDRNLSPAYLEQHMDGEKRKFSLDGDRVLRIGRSASKNTIVLDDTLASREHAMLQRSDAGAFYLTDLNSSNGTVVNGARITRPVILKSGDHITIGSHEFDFYQEASPKTAERSPISEGVETTVFRTYSLITVLVVDVRDFTRLSRKLDSEKVVQIIRCFFRESGMLLQDRGAWAQKYIGDAVMSVWVHGAGVVELRDLVPVFEGVWKMAEIAAGLQGRFGLDAPIRIGAGANTGWASVGNVGSIASADHTALGEVVNKAFRLESATKDVSCDFLIGQETLDVVAHGCDAGIFERCTVTLKGYDEAETAFGTRFTDLEPFLKNLKHLRNSSTAS